MVTEIDAPDGCAKFQQYDMSTSKIDPVSNELLASSEDLACQRLTLPTEAVVIRRNGIEFRSAKPITQWAEMSVDLESPWDGTKINCRGVVVACEGNRHAGYIVSLMFMNLTPQNQQQLDSIAYSQAGF